MKSMLRIPPATAATPLISLTALAFDTETTSLDVETGRIIEIGAVAMVDGAISNDTAFVSFVKPHVDIPAASTKIHGITSNDLGQAPEFAEAWKSFRIFAAGHILLGYSIDFDLMLLEKEHARAGLAWKPPTALDVRGLVRLLRATLPDYALETVAEWLGVGVIGRHRAQPDALLTAQVFLGLLPRLREQGIRTLGEALAASRKLEERQGRPSLITATSGRLTVSPIARTDSFPYRHRVADIMARPPVMISAEATIADAMDLMIAEKVSSAFVQGSPLGILTERDVLRAFAAGRQKAFNAKIASVASFPLRTVETGDFIYVAIGMMRSLKVRHLGVVDSDGALVGALSQRDLLRLRADEALSLTNALSEAASPAELAIVWKKLADAAEALLAEDVDARDVAAIISSEICALTSRAAGIAEKEAKSARPADLRYAVMVLGSGGRGESLLALDQDNAIIFEAGDEDGARDWLMPVAARMNSILDEVGVPLCKGGVMAKNSQWCMSDKQWRQQVAQWISRTNPQDILNADIFFDSVAVFGEESLAHDLRQHAITAAAAVEPFLKLMSVNAASPSSAFGWLGRLSTEEDGRMDLKRLGIMPIFTAARVASLRYRIYERSTRGRLEALRGNPDVRQHVLDSLQEAHRELFGFILRQQLQDLEDGIPPSNRVSPAALSAREKERLKWALKQVANVADIVGAPVA